MLTLPELALLGFASYRATQLGVHDSILEPARQRLGVWHANNLDSKPRGFVMTLIGCIYCLGWWISGATLFTYLHATGQWANGSTLTQTTTYALDWFAVAGVQALLNRRDDTWDA